MIIDIHTHTFPDKIVDQAIKGMIKGIDDTHGFKVENAIRGSYDALMESTKNSGIDLSIVQPVATNPMQSEKINQQVYKVNEHYQETGVYSFGAIHPENENYREILQELKNHDVKGIKIHPDYQHTFIDNSKYLNIIDYAANLGLIIMTHAGEDIGMPEPRRSSVDRISNLLNQIDPDYFILAHMGGWNQWKDVEEQLIGRKIYFDTSFCFAALAIPHLETSQFKHLVELHGYDKILFGTDSPWASQKDTLSKIRQMNFDKEAEDKILGENIKEILQLK